MHLEKSNNAFIYGTDGRWHRMNPNQSLYALGDTNDDVIEAINGLEYADNEAKAAIVHHNIEVAGEYILMATAIYGNLQLSRAFKNSSVVNKKTATKTLSETGLAVKQLLKRLPQDIKLGVNKKAPPIKATRGRTIGKNQNQNKSVQEKVAELKEQGATDIRIDQQQVNVKGEHVGINRPDLQYTKNGKRYYVEWDTSKSGRGPGHESRIRANDPNAGGVEQIIMD